MPEATKYENGLCYSLLYTLVSEEFFRADRDYKHIVTANVGYLYQHEVGVSFLGRGGVGLSRRTLVTTDEEKHIVYPWLNLEFSLGYAF